MSNLESPIQELYRLRDENARLRAALIAQQREIDCECGNCMRARDALKEKV